ncbi:alginate lyase family protein [uncultured Nocardioides sp.]|uniref:heparinase II/III family protein n=1 Tax=uncultured Nocardioides sp. TaxID=198441 RepID=UPI00261AA92C|nr:alginate lyase family protein [uncultured Nocardioides sp.]
MAGGRLGWYARRLRTMGPAELAWRVRRAAQDAVPARPGRRSGLPDDDAWWDEALAAFRRADDRPVLLDRERAEAIAAAAPASVAAVVAAAERVREGRVQYFGYPKVRLADPVDWHHDPLRDHHWPRVAARRLDHRTAPADPKWIWELNRLQHLPWLAQAWLVTGCDEFAETAFAHLDSWVEQNPVGVGVAWRGAFEAGVRAISVLVALQGLRDSPLLDRDRFRRLVEVLDAGAEACWRERSLHSSANNHLVGELAGLATTALLLPELPRAARWRARAVEALTLEADRQVLPDGAGAEQAVGYQVFTAELLLVVLTLLRAGGDDVPRALEHAVRRSGDFLAALVADDEPAPRYGDDDEGFALRLGPASHPTVPDHLALLAAYGAVQPPADLPAVGVGPHWVHAATAGALDPVPGPWVPPAGPAASRHAPYGGLVVLRSREGADADGRRQRVTVDVGPLGYLSIAAHGHADALALTWTLDGEEVVEDPGTASYYGHPAWRTAHRSTAAHATVAVDDEDSSQMAGPFLWTTYAAVTDVRVDLVDGIVEAAHDGYLRLPDPVRHRRRVVAAPDRLGLEVRDSLEVPGGGSHSAVVSWPLAPGLSAQPTAAGTSAGVSVLRADGTPVATAAVTADVDVDVDVVRADPDTHLGWSSSRLEAREPASLVRFRVRAEGHVSLTTVWRPARQNACPENVQDSPNPPG